MDSHDDLITIISALAEANAELMRAASTGNATLMADLLEQVSSLEQRRNRLVHKAGTSSRSQRPNAGYESSVPLRDQVIRALHLVGRPATGRLLADVTKARWNESIEINKLSSLRRDEARSWSAGQDSNRRTAIRDVYIVPALSYDRYAPVRGSLALSTWETARRLVAPLSPRVDMLKSTIALAQEVIRLGQNGHGVALNRLVCRLGASIPGVNPFTSSMQEVIACAQTELSQLEEVDFGERCDAASRAERQLTLDALLFGAPVQSIKTGKLDAYEV
jgi:hypothetical protein